MDNNALHQQEVRRQAMLHVMQLDVWLPRQSLPFAAPSSEHLLRDFAAPEQLAISVQAVPQNTAAIEQQTTGHVPVPQAQASLAKIRDGLQREAPVPAEVAMESAAVPELATESVARVEIPRFTMQLLHCAGLLLVVELAVAESLQGRDPEFLLLRDILRAAQVPGQPVPLLQGEPIRWPVLTSGDLVHRQDEQAARAYLRELLRIQCAQQPTHMLWLLGENAVRFAGQPEDGAELFGMTAFTEHLQCWALPSLEQLMASPALKRQLWQSMQQHMSRWSADEPV